MKKLELPMSALEIMQASLKVYEKDTAAVQYLNMIEKAINGDAIQLSSNDFLELHKFVITKYSNILDNAKVTEGKWTVKQWENVLKQIEWCYDKEDTYEVIIMKK